ncbi:Juvenile hormone esterase, partial [Operophtera brumata]
MHTDAGWVCGRLREAENGAKYASFRGELEPAVPWSFLLDCTEDAPACPQTDLIYGRIPLQHRGMSEDCMYLNLHVPSRCLPRFPWPAKGPGLPILVFIYGGAFQSGAGLTDAFGPEYMLTKDNIVITFNYRMNFFGFFSLNTIEIPGNQGFRDMVTLLCWVQRNACAFGGDPNNVTVMGQGSGATSAHILFLLDCTEDAPACPQTDLIYGRIPLQHRGMSEDCMYLNLHVPSGCLPRFPWPAKGPGLPILVFIYGGAFQSGAGLADAFGPEMNFFGFFSLNTIEIPGNQGFRDMVTLLCWVQRNARAFGGDPNNVTLMGQGSGATSAHILVILMSCTGFPSYFTTSAEYAKKVSGMFLQELGINQTDPVLIHRELTKIPLLKIMHANTAVQFNTPIVSFNPVVESPFPG